jgi:hypothetical protein
VAIVLAVVVSGTAIAAGGPAAPTRAPSPAAAKAALGRALHQLYGRIYGYWTCPPPAELGRIDCLAEVHGEGHWHQVFASATHSNGVTWIERVSAQTWTRRWSPFSRHFILRSDEPQVPGVVSVNGPAYDWGWLAGAAADIKAGQTRQADAYDGNDTGLTRFFIFTCSRPHNEITCKNKLGDAMRYRP